MELTSKNVQSVLLDSLFQQHPEDESKAVKVEGVVGRFGFDPERLKKHEEDVVSMLKQLPKEFHKEVGGGYSFLGACNRADGQQWGEHRSMDELFCLGIALGKVAFAMPREMWAMLPGGMPYLIVDVGVTS